MYQKKNENDFSQVDLLHVYFKFLACLLNQK